MAFECVGVEIGNEEGRETQGANDNEEPLRNSVDLPQHICLDVLGRVDETIDGTNLGEISSRDDDSNSTSLSNKSRCIVFSLEDEKC